MFFRFEFYAIFFGLTARLFLIPKRGERQLNFIFRLAAYVSLLSKGIIIA